MPEQSLEPLRSSNVKLAPGGRKASIKPYEGRIKNDSSTREIIDLHTGKRIQCDSHYEMSRLGSFVRAYLKAWGDIDFDNLPSTIDDPFEEPA